MNKLTSKIIFTALFIGLVVGLFCWLIEGLFLGLLAGLLGVLYWVLENLFAIKCPKCKGLLIRFWDPSFRELKTGVIICQNCGAKVNYSGKLVKKKR